MPVYNPPLSKLREVAERAGLTLSDEELAFLLSLGEGVFRSCERIDSADGHRLPVKYARGGAWKPEPEDNPLNAWAWRCSVEGASEGLLAGRTVVLKDIIPVAGVPMSAGSALLQGHASDFDATIVTRILDAGGTIVGVAATEDMCLSGASVSAVTGMISNPQDPSRSAGGSSSGVAALVGSGACDVGIGADQGGSIRIPSSLSGVFGMKPTYGLIPYTGCIPIDVSVDYVGPMARTATDTALLLEAVAGFDDGLDPRQRQDFSPPSYSEELHGTIEGLRVALVREGFGKERMSEEDVDETVRDAARGFEELGAKVEEVSIPEHDYSMDIHASILLQGGSEFMVRGNGIGMAGKGFYDANLSAVFARGRKLQSDLLFASVKYAMVIGGYLWEKYGGYYYAKAQNLAVRLRHRYNEALKEFDVLMMPTTCIKAPKLPSPDAPPLEAIKLALDPALISNTCAFNHTGHPALSVPIGPSEGLPVGLMLIGRHFEDHVVLRAAHSLEEAGKTLKADARRLPDADESEAGGKKTAELPDDAWKTRGPP